VHKESEIFINGDVGQLQARYCELPHTNQAKAMILLCHPDPTQEGTMLNKVISTTQRTARDANLITLRFNYRGVMQSAGTHDMQTGEINDALSCIKWLKAKHSNLPLVIAGFSFGGFVAISAAQQLAISKIVDLKQLILIAPAIGRTNNVNNLPCFASILAPANDEILNPQDLTNWSEQLTTPHKLITLEDCGHFFHSKLVELKNILQIEFNNL